MANKSIYYPIGTILTDGNVTLEIVENDSCYGCYYLRGGCKHPTDPKCTEDDRCDRKLIIYKAIKSHRTQNSLESRIAVLEAQINVQNKKIDIVLSQLAESIKTH